MLDDTEAINVEPREVWQYMWDTLTTRDTAIVNAQEILRTEYDSEKPINTTFKIIQNAKFLLQYLNTPITEREISRNFVHSLGVHVDYQRGIRNWNKFVEESAATNPAVTVIWQHWKTHFTKYCTELESDPSTKKALNTANAVTAQVEQAAADTKFAAQVALDNAEAIATLKVKIAELKSKENIQNCTNQVTTQEKQTNPQAAMMQVLMETMKIFLTDNSKKKGPGGNCNGPPPNISNIQLHKRQNNLGDEKWSFNRYRTLTGTAGHADSNFTKLKCGPQSRKTGYTPDKDAATVTNRMDGSMRNMHL